MEFTEFTIDAKGKILGKVASQAASLLMGKNRADFVRNKVLGDTVNIVNASKLKIDPKKLEEKLYIHYTGYPGGIKKESMSHLTSRKGFEEILRLAVFGMLPGNKLRVKMMKNLKISE